MCNVYNIHIHQVYFRQLGPYQTQNIQKVYEKIKSKIISSLSANVCGPY